MSRDHEQLAVEYGRYSQDTQDSVEDQHDMNEETALDIPARIVKSFADEAVSRSISDREDLVATLEYLKAHPEVRILIITQWDRLIGGLTQHTDVISILRRLKVRLYTYDGQLDYTNDDVLSELEHKSVSSADEVRRARKRVRKALRTKNRKGRYTSRPPFGLRMMPVIRPDGTEVATGEQLLDEKGRVIRSAALDLDPTQYDGTPAHEWLERIFVWTARDVGALEVCKRLAASGVATKGGAGWTTQAVARIVANRVYLGERVWGASRVVHDDYGNRKYHEARDQDDHEVVVTTTNLGVVIDRKLWEDANAVLAQRARIRARSPRSTSSRTYAPRVLNDLVFCGRCGLKMYPRRDSKILANGERATTWRFLCQGRSRAAVGHKRHDGDDRAVCTVGHSLAELTILDALRGQLSKRGSIDYVEARMPKPDATAQRDSARHAIKLAGEAVTRIKDAYDNGVYDLAETKQRLGTQEATIATCEAQLVALEAEQAKAGSVPQTVRVEVATTMRELLVDALTEYETIERTTQGRTVMHDAVASLISRIEVDAPDVRVHLRVPTGA